MLQINPDGSLVSIRGDDIELQVELVDAEGVTYPTDNYDIVLTARENDANGDVMFTATAGDDGVIHIPHTATQTAFKGIYDIQGTNTQTGYVTTLINPCAIEIREDVTR